MGTDTPLWENTPKNRRRNRVIIVSGFLITLAVAVLYIARPSLRHTWENKAYDLLLRPTPVTHGPTTPAIIDIDEKSLARYGQWPWPRYRIARLVEKIQDAGVTALGIDILFAEVDRTSLQTIREHLSQEFQIPMQLSGIPDHMIDNDGTLAETLSRGAVIMGSKFGFRDPIHQDQNCRLHPLNLIVAHGENPSKDSPRLLQATSVACPLPRLASHSAGSGFINATPDSDGILRRLPLVIQYQDQFYPSLALAAFCQAHGISQAVIALEKGKIKNLNLGKFQVPLDGRGTILIRYHRRINGFPYYSAADLLDGSLDPRVLSGRIAFLGTSAAGLN